MASTLSPEQREHIRDLFDAVVDLDAEACLAYLDQACRDHPGLREEVEALLAAYAHVDDVLASYEHALPGLQVEAAEHTSPTDPHGLVGQRVAHYQIQEKLGGGGMGVVYKALDTTLHRTVALKFLPPELTRNPEAKVRFLHEARAAAALDHANIGVVHEIGQTEAGQVFIAMAFYEGETLKAKIGRGALPVAEALDYAVQMAQGLEKAHDAGIVHRDIKPANVMVTEDSVVKIVDFGIAKMAVQTQLTKTGATVGTVSYMSPEQARGAGVDARSDIWSLGVVLYEMLTGGRPFRGDYEQAVLYSILNVDPEPITDLRPEAPEALAQVVLKMLRKEPAERYQHVDDMRVDLTALQNAEAAQGSHALHRPAAASKTVSVKTRVLFGGLALFMLLATAAAFYLTRGDEQQGAVEIERKRLVVLPFDNLGPPEDDYFADGLTEEITSRLALVYGLSVISRASAVQYKNTNTTSEQMKEDGVDYILEGTVGWDKSSDGMSRVRVTPQLIRTSDDTQVWAERYDRVLDELFDIQSDIAEQVVKQLDIQLVEPVLQALFAKPTRNLEAYDYYLQGNEHSDLGEKFSDEKELEQAVQMYQKAIDLDPDFALAYNNLAYTHSMFCYLYDQTDERRTQARAAIEKALEIQPDLPHLQFGLFWYYYYCLRDYDRALEVFQTVRTAIPSIDPYLLAIILRRQGRWQESVAAMEETVALNPRNAGRAYNLAASYMCLRQYREADTWYDRALSLDPGFAPAIIWKYRNRLLWKGSANDLRTSLHTIQRNPSVNSDLQRINLLEGRFQEALADVDSLSESSVWGYKPKDFAYAEIYARMGEPTAMKTHAQYALPLLEQAVQEQPTDYRRHASLGQTYAFLGRKEEAIREGIQAVDLFPVSKDALFGPSFVGDLAWIYALVGEQEKAIERLAYLLSIPSDFSVPLLRIDPRWDGLRDHPGFEEMLRKYEMEEL